MVISKLVGGLGNQLFQYAAARAVAFRTRSSLKLDTSIYQTDRLRKYRLGHFNIVASVATPFDLARVPEVSPWRYGKRARAAQLMTRFLPGYAIPVLTEPHFHFSPELLNGKGSAYLVGFWQSERYFKGIEQAIRAELTVKTPPDRDNQAMLELIHDSQSVSLHIRRTDYVSDPINRNFYSVCSLSYYHDAVELQAQRLRRPRFFVFSDDIAWAEQNLRIDYPTTYVGHNGEDRDYEDLRLMSQCRHHIIANSTFGWWGAWLCDYPEKIVIAPEKWFIDPNTDTKDLLPASWLRS